jgi:signal transduction histidine kinase
LAKRRANNGPFTTADSNRTGPEIRKVESLVAELSAAMAQVPADVVDREIDAWLGRICVTLDLDRSAIYERDLPGSLVRTSHTWLRKNFPAFPRNFDPEKLFKTTTDWIMRGNHLIFSHVKEIPDELSDAREFVERYGPKASAVIPMWAGNRVIGAASFGRFRSPREWSPQLLEHLRLAVRIFAAAIERKQAEAAVRTAHAELTIAQRRSMMGELVASLAHELNQPLGAILSNLGGLARLLSQGNPEPAIAARAVNNAIEDTKRAGEIIRRVRAMFKGDATQKVALDLGVLVSEIVRLIASEATHREIAVRVEAQRSIPRVVGDRILLQQCVLNLLLNSFESILAAKPLNAMVTIGIARERIGWIAVSVSDNGGGLHESIAGRVFEAFVTTKSKGLGLGLLVTKSIVEEHGGRIWSSANPDGGTTFTFTLPAEGKRPRRVLSRSLINGRAEAAGGV